MKHGICFVVTVVAILTGMSGWAQNPNAPTHTINYTGGPTIDGDLSDWGNAEWITYDKDSVVKTFGTNWNDPDAICTFSTLYNEEALYCAADVEDYRIYHVNTTTPFEWWTRDGVQWFIDFTNNPEQEILLYPDFFDNIESGGQWLPGEMIIAIGATEDQTVNTTRRWCVGTRLGNRSDVADKTLEDGTVVRGEVNEGWEVAVFVDGTKYIIEAKIPWDSIQRSKYYSDPDPLPAEIDFDEMDKLGWTPRLPDPLAGSTISFTHLCIDTDLPAGGFDAQAMWVGDGDDDAHWTTATFAIPTPVGQWELF